MFNKMSTKIGRSASQRLRNIKLFQIVMPAAATLMMLVACISSSTGTSGKLARPDRPVAGAIAGPAPTPPSAPSAPPAQNEDETHELIAGPISARIVRRHRHLEAFEGDLLLGNPSIQLVIEGVGYTAEKATWHPFIKAMFLPDSEGVWRQDRDQWQQGHVEFGLIAKDGASAVASAVVSVDSSVDRKLGAARVVLGVSSGEADVAESLVISLPGKNALVDLWKKQPGLRLRISTMQRSWSHGDWFAAGQQSVKVTDKQTVPYIFSAPRLVDQRQPLSPMVIAAPNGFKVSRQRHHHVVLSSQSRSSELSPSEGAGFLIAAGNKATALFPALLSAYFACPRAGGHIEPPVACFGFSNSIEFVAGVGTPPVYPLGWSLLTPAGKVVLEGVWTSKDQTLFNLSAQVPLKGWNLLVDRDETRAIPLESTAVVPSRMGSIKASLAMPESPLRPVIFSMASDQGKTRPAALFLERQEPRGSLIATAPGSLARSGNVDPIVLREGVLLVKRWPIRLELPVGLYVATFVLGQAGEVCSANFQLSTSTTKDQRVTCQISADLMKRRSQTHSFVDPRPVPFGINGLDRNTWRLLNWTDFFNDELVREVRWDSHTGWAVYALIAKPQKNEPGSKEALGLDFGAESPATGGDSLKSIAAKLRSENPGNLIVLECPRAGATAKSLREAIAMTTPDAVSALGCAQLLEGGEVLRDLAIMNVVDEISRSRDARPPVFFPAMDEPGRFNPFVGLQLNGTKKDLDAEGFFSAMTKRNFGVTAGARVYVREITFEDNSQQLAVSMEFEPDAGVDVKRIVVTAAGVVVVSKIVSGPERSLKILMPIPAKWSGNAKAKSRILRIDLIGVLSPASDAIDMTAAASASGVAPESVIATTNNFEVEAYLPFDGHQRSTIR